MTALDHTSKPLVEIRSFLKKAWRDQNPEQWAEQLRKRNVGITDGNRTF